MKGSKSYKYKNYGPIPQNEYRTNPIEKDAGFIGALGYDPSPDDMAYQQRLIRRQAQHPCGRRRIQGWSRTWNANGWRAESVALHDEFTDMGRYSGHV